MNNETQEAPAPVSTAPAPARARPAALRRSSDTLTLAWVHGVFHAAVYRRQNRGATWTAATPVRTLEEFAAALDETLASTSFTGTDTLLVLGHDEFVHQLESAPAFSEKAALSYLRGRVERFEKEHEPALSVSQRAASVRKDAAFILHLLPRRFYDELLQVMRSRRLELTRILPLLVPLQRELPAGGETGDTPILLACEAGDATAVVVGRANGEVFFTRTTLASWRTEPGRVAIEINRSLLYAKQQFAAVIDRIWLLGDSAEAARPEVETKCGAGKHVSVRAASPADWLEAAARLPARHPVNLVAGYLQSKSRQRFFRRVLIGGAWLGLVLLGFDQWNRQQRWEAEATRLAGLRIEEPALLAEQERLLTRNAEVDRHRTILRQVVDGRLPPVPGRFLAYIAATLPREARLTDFMVKWDEATDAWSFRLDGTLETDEETARGAIAGVRRQLARGPLRVHFVDTVRASASATGGGEPALQRFSLEGGLFEN